MPSLKINSHLCCVLTWQKYSYEGGMSLKVFPDEQINCLKFWIWGEKTNNAQEGTLSEKISRYVEIHRKNRFDVRIQDMVSKVQFFGLFREKRFLLPNPKIGQKTFYSQKGPRKLNFWNQFLYHHIKRILLVYLNI